MPERDGYQAGVPCWVNVALPDPAAGVRFYSELFGWEFEDRMPPEAPGRYFIAKLRGREVAAVGSQPEDAGGLAYWSTYICVDDADETAAKVRAAAGRVLDEPFDVFDAGRMAVCVDSGGAVFCVWQPRRHRGAQLVNEPGAWNWSELNTRDPEAVKAFYGEVFGWETAAFDLGDGDSYTIWRVPGYDPGDRGDVDAPDD